jgi:hypothetical protein
LVEAVSRQVGISGTSYSKKEINSKEYCSRYLREEDNIEEAWILLPSNHLAYINSGTAGGYYRYGLFFDK